MIPQLRVRTEFSFRQAFGPTMLTAQAAATTGAQLAGIVDGDTWGHVRWSKACAAAGIAPAFGTEVEVKISDTRRPVAWVLAERGRIGDFYRFSTALRKPDADPLTLLAGAPGVRFAGTALTDPELFDCVDINPGSPLARRAAIRLAERTGKPIIITSDNAYPRTQDYKAFMALYARERVTPQHILTLDEMRAAMPELDDAAWAAAVRATNEVAERLATGLNKAPIIHFEGDLRALVARGKEERVRLGHITDWTEEYEARMMRELDIIEQKEFESYFLVVSDLVQWAKQHMLVGPGRGSSAGSLVCYLLRITEVDPLQHSLLFERFIDLTRKDLPDIDIDFSDTKREQVFRYLADRYGESHVARIGNVSTLKPRSVMAEVCKRMGIDRKESFPVINALIEYSSGDSRFGKGLEDTLNNTDAGQYFMRKYPAAAVMGECEGHAHHTSVHAAGVIVANVRVDEYCTIGADGVAHIDKPDVDVLGLLKIDALGLRTLGVIEDAGCVTGDQLYALKLDDEEAFRVLNERRYAGVFQFEGHSQRSIAAQVNIKSFAQIDHLTAIARPGPLGSGAAAAYVRRADGREAVEYAHPSMESYLKDNLGLILYQEDVMRMGRELGGFSWEDTTHMRKGMSGRKGTEFLQVLGDKFVDNAVLNGMERASAEDLWKGINQFGAWAMNKCISGDARVRLARGNQFTGSEPTIRELYDVYVANPSSWIRQNKLMPVLLAFDGSSAMPKRAANIMRSGVKDCIRVETADGRSFECTKDHKFIVNGAWAPIGNAKIGDALTNVSRKPWIDQLNPGRGKGWRKGRRGAGAIDVDHGIAKSMGAFQRMRSGSACDDCLLIKKRMEVHHNDFNKGRDRPEDLAWLCSGCHKQRHMDAGRWLPPFGRGWTEAAPAIITSIQEVGLKETFDIEMEGEHPNFVLANGIVTHNSHTCAYSVIAYWCAWMKAHHPIEYAAACLRNADDEVSAYEVLRELDRAGIGYIPFDVNLSGVNWRVHDGKLLGGFLNLKGFGPAKAAKAIELRDAGRLTRDDPKGAKMLDAVEKAELSFRVLYPLKDKYREYYEHPERFGCREGSHMMTTEEFPDKGEVLFIAQVRSKERRDENDAVRLARRNGRRKPGQTLFTDIWVVDDCGLPYLARIEPRDFEPLGRLAAEKLEAEKDIVMIRGDRIKGYPMVKVKRMRCLTNPEALMDRHEVAVENG